MTSPFDSEGFDPPAIDLSFKKRGVLEDIEEKGFFEKRSEVRDRVDLLQFSRELIRQARARAAAVYLATVNADDGVDEAIASAVESGSTEVLSNIVEASQTVVANYISGQVAKQTGERPVKLDPSIFDRDGVSKAEEYARPYRVAAKAVADGDTRARAVQKGLRRLNSLVGVDIQMAKVRQAQASMRKSKVQFYRRVPTSSNPCELCEIASSDIYATNELMPIHDNCSCDIEIIDNPEDLEQHELQAQADEGFDPPAPDGLQKEDIAKLNEDDASPQDYRDLIQVREHGEIGPMLTWRSQDFTGPNEIAQQVNSAYVKNVYDTAVRNEGITINLAGEQPNEGFAFAPRKDTEFPIPMKDFKPEDIDKYIDDHYELLSQPGNHLGLWLSSEDGNMYMDVSKVGTPDEKTIAQAQKAKQLAVFDLSNFNTIDVGTIDEEGKYTKLGKASDLNDQYRRKIEGTDQGGSQGGVSEIRSVASKAVDEPLEWTGPKVAEPSKFVEVGQDINYRWTSGDFDETKQAMREGVRDVQLHGYSGLTDKEKAAFVSLSDLHTSTFPEELHLVGKEIAARAIYAKPTEQELYRGIGMTQSDIDELKVGGKLSIPASSFAVVPEDAKSYAIGQSSFGWVSKDYPSGGKPVVLKLESGAKVTSIEGGDYERVGFGTFKIVNIDPLARIDVNGDFVAGPPGPNDRSVTLLTVRQESLQEYVPPAAASGADRKIPEYTIVPGVEMRVGFDPKNYVPPDDSWLKPQPGDIQNYDNPIRTAKQLEARHPKLDVEFPTYWIADTGPATSAARAVDDLLDKYPQANIREVSGTKRLSTSNRYAETDVWQAGLAMDRDMTATEIRLDKDRFADGKTLEKSYQHAIDVGYHPPKDGSDAATTIVTHEFGHGMDATGGYQASQKCLDTLKTVYEKEAEGSATADGFKDWMKSKLSAYSFDDFGALNPTEAVAEAFAHVETDPATANSAEKALYELVVNASKDKAAASKVTKPGWVMSAGVQPSKTVDAQEQSRLDAAKAKQKAADDKEAAKQAKAAAREARAAEKEQKRIAKEKEEEIKAREKARGFGSVEARIKEGTEVKPIYQMNADGTFQMMEIKDEDTGEKSLVKKVDVAATWAQLEKDGYKVLEDNWKAALDASEPWAKELGAKWYPDLTKMCDTFVEKYGEQFQKEWGIPLTRDLAASFIAAWSENNKWAGNLIGVRKWLDGSGSRPYFVPLNSYDYSLRKEYAKKYKELTGSDTGYDFHVDKAMRAMKNPLGGVADLRSNATTAPKPADFAANAAGDYMRGTTDRWVARIMLHTDDKGFAEQMRTYARTVNKVNDPVGYKRMAEVLERVAKERGMDTSSVQAIPWVHVVGPLGSVAYINDLSSYDAIKAETLAEVSKIEAKFAPTAVGTAEAPDKGNLVTVYHGTNAENANKIVTDQSWLPGNGGWFTTDLNRARAYAGDSGSVVSLDVPRSQIKAEPAGNPEFYIPQKSRALRRGTFQLVPGEK